MGAQHADPRVGRSGKADALVELVVVFRKIGALNARGYVPGAAEIHLELAAQDREPLVRVLQIQIFHEDAVSGEEAIPTRLREARLGERDVGQRREALG
jgi:hypothetical protein